MNEKKYKITVEQTEILYNLCYYKTMYDINHTDNRIFGAGEKARELKKEWVDEWKEYVTKGFSKFLNVEGATLHWYAEDELIHKIKNNGQNEVWFRLVLLDAMIFEPYYPLSTIIDNNGQECVNPKYNKLMKSSSYNMYTGYNSAIGDKYLDFFTEFIGFSKKDYIKRLRKSYNEAINKFTIKEIFGNPIASILLAGSLIVNMLSLNSVVTFMCSGGALLYYSKTAKLAVTAMGKYNAIQQSAKLMVMVKEIFLKDEHDFKYVDAVYEEYVKNIVKLEKLKNELSAKEGDADKKEKKDLQIKIKNIEETINAFNNGKNCMKTLTGLSK